jgi:tRNA dimethylallyltransferase
VNAKSSGSSDSSIVHYELPEKKQRDLGSGSKKVIVLSGPTATGKTEMSINLAKAIGGEIISVDSMQVYRGMTIGTAKATLEQQLEIPHHLIDIRDLSQTFNVVEFYQEAMQAMDSIFARNKIPILVGGTGFYIHTLLYGPPLGPPGDSLIRKRIEDDIEKFGPEPLYEKLKEFDPVYAQKITPKDRHKIVRALEIITLTHKKVSDFLKEPDPNYHSNLNFRCWFIYYAKAILYPRIETRCEEMLDRGFLDEVKFLEREGLRDNLSASQAIGYKQALDYFKTAQTPGDYEEFVSLFKKVSRKYAKRQFTWFRKEPLFRWIDLESYGTTRAMELILHDFDNAL